MPTLLPTPIPDPAHTAAMRPGTTDPMPTVYETNLALLTIANARDLGMDDRVIVDRFGSACPAEFDRILESGIFHDTGVTVVAWRVRAEVLRLVTH